MIHDSVSEVLAYHYGKEHQEDMLQYMSSSFVAKKFKINKHSDDPVDLHIKLSKKHYPAFAERLVRDLKCLELHDVFENEALKEPCICDAFIVELKKLPYLEIKKLFFIKQEDTSKIFIRKDEEMKKGREEYEWYRQELLIDNTRGKPNIRVISWVIAYGHYQLLQFLFDLVIDHKESIWHVMGLEIPRKSGETYISDLREQSRYLILSCCNDNVEVVRLILKHCDFKECICCRYDFCTTPLEIACQVGHVPLVKLLIQCGANCNQRDILKRTPLHVASECGHDKVVDLLIECSANLNTVDIINKIPLHLASSKGNV